ncbi:MAG: superoxide dismutase [Chitinophagaceae bacterium]|nr:superoxide dismutase [Chitinophagaceae bacterium]
MSKKSNSSRRDFISNTIKGGLALGFGLSAVSPLTSCAAVKNIPVAVKTGFDQQPLPYAYNALENAIDAMTMEIHYSKHAAGYAKNVKEAAAAEAVDMTKPLEDVLAKISNYSAKMRNNAGGHYNHEMFWQCMRPKTDDNKPTGKLMEAITAQFTSFEYFKKQFGDAAKTRFGSGWAWLYINKNKKLTIGSTPNQDNPLMDLSDIKGFPVLAIDVWEHAYYLKYQNKRAEYVDNWWQLVNWDYVETRFNSLA